MTTTAFQAFVALKNNQPEKAKEILEKFFTEVFYPNTIHLAEEFLNTEPEQAHIEGYLDTLFADDQKWMDEIE